MPGIKHPSSPSSLRRLRRENETLIEEKSKPERRSLLWGVIPRANVHNSSSTIVENKQARRLSNRFSRVLEEPS